MNGEELTNRLIERIRDAEGGHSGYFIKIILMNPATAYAIWGADDRYNSTIQGVPGNLWVCGIQVNERADMPDEQMLLLSIEDITVKQFKPGKSIFG